MGQNRIRGGWGVKNCRKSSDIIYVRSLTVALLQKFVNEFKGKYTYIILDSTFLLSSKKEGPCVTLFLAFETLYIIFGFLQWSF